MLGLINGWTSLQANHYKKPPLADCLSYLDANLLDFYFYTMNGIRRCCYRWTSRSYVWWWLSPSLIAAIGGERQHSAKGPFVTSCLSYNLSVAQTGHAAQLWYHSKTENTKIWTNVCGRLDRFVSDPFERKLFWGVCSAFNKRGLIEGKVYFSTYKVHTHSDG